MWGFVNIIKIGNSFVDEKEPVSANLQWQIIFQITAFSGSLVKTIVFEEVKMKYFNTRITRCQQY